MTEIRKTHHEMIREAIIELKEARPKGIIEYIKKKYPQINVNESSFRADIIGCSINHSSTHHYPGMPKFLFFKKQKGTYTLYDPERNGKSIMSGKSQKKTNTKTLFSAISRIRHRKKQKLSTLINEETMLLASFIRGKRIWEPRVVPLPTITMPKILKVKRKTEYSFEPFFPRGHF